MQTLTDLANRELARAKRQREERLKEIAEPRLCTLPKSIDEWQSAVRQSPAECELCGDLGYYTLDVPIEHRNFGKLLPCECLQQKMARGMQANCGLNEDEQKTRLNDVTKTGGATDAVISAARSFIARPFAFLTLWGGYGNGKSTVLQAIVNESLDVGRPARYVTLRELIESVKECFGEGARMSSQAMLRRYQDIPVLCIDEVDKPPISDWAEGLRSELFDKRYRDGLAGLCGTALAMNLSPESCLQDWLSSRVYDGRCVVRRNEDIDMRPFLRNGE